jgi:hypothetical protein
MGLKSLVAAAALVVAVAVSVALLAGRDGGPRVQGIQAEATLDPTAALFGDRLSAEVRVVLDRRKVDPDSVVVSADFGALSAPAVTAPVRERAGDVVVLRYRYGLFCLRDECRARDGLRRLRFRPAAVHYQLRDGGTRRTGRLEWPAVTVGTRLGGQPAGIADWRIRDELPPPTYRLSPRTVAALGFSLALVCALLGALLVVSVLRALLRRAPVDELEGLSPLERALRLLRLALANGSPPEHRRALDRLARELRREGHRDLAGEARKLAWQRPGPDRSEADVLAGRVANAIGAHA